VRRTVGFKMVCPRCNERKTLRSVTLARAWLYAHDCIAPMDAAPEGREDVSASGSAEAS